MTLILEGLLFNGLVLSSKMLVSNFGISNFINEILCDLKVYLFITKCIFLCHGYHNQEILMMPFLFHNFF